MSQDFYKNSLIYGVWTNISRIFGLIRDNICGRLFGTSLEFGAFTLAFRIPDLFRRLLEEGALSAIFTPVITQQLEKENRQKAIDFTSNVFSVLLITITLICAILIILLLGISQLITLSTEWQHTLNYFLILTPYLIFIGLISLLSSILNVLGDFFSTAISPILFNVAWIASLIIAWQFYQANNDKLILICFFLTFSGVLQVGLLLTGLQKFDWKVKFSIQKDFLPSRKIIKKIIVVLFCFAIFQINLLIDGVLCLFFVESKHALAALYYSDRIQQLPLAVISISIATASFPLLASFYSQGKIQEFRNTLTKSIRGVWFLTLPSSIGIFFLANPLAQLLFSFKDPTSTAETSSTLIFFSIGLVFTCTTPILTRVFYAIGEIKTALITGIIIICINVVLGVAFALTTDLGGSALALATSLSSILNACILFYIADKKFKLIDITQIKANFFKIIAPSMALTSWLILTKQEVFQKCILQISTNFLWLTNHTQLLYLIVAFLGGVLIFFLASIFIKPTEFKEIIGRSK